MDLITTGEVKEVAYPPIVMKTDRGHSNADLYRSRAFSGRISDLSPPAQFPFLSICFMITILLCFARC